MTTKTTEEQQQSGSSSSSTTSQEAPPAYVSGVAMDHAALFASVICEVVDQNRSLGLIQQLQQQANCSQSPFESTRAPSYPLERYLQRIARYATSSPSCFLIALVYMDRIIAAQHGTFVLSELNVHRLFMSCLVVATKFWSDHFYDNAFYGRVGGISAREMSSLEVAALIWLDFRLTVDGAAFLDNYHTLSASCPGRPLIIPTLMARLRMLPSPTYPSSDAPTPYEHILSLLCAANAAADDERLPAPSATPSSVPTTPQTR